MKKYKVEITSTRSFVVDVFAKDETEAMEKAHIVWYDNIVPTGTEHYYENRDEDVEIGSVIYDVTNTDDPFNPINT